MRGFVGYLARSRARSGTALSYSRRAKSVAAFSVSTAMAGPFYEIGPSPRVAGRRISSQYLMRLSSNFADAAGVEYGYLAMHSSNVRRAMARSDRKSTRLNSSH